MLRLRLRLRVIKELRMKNEGGITVNEK